MPDADNAEGSGSKASLRRRRQYRPIPSAASEGSSASAHVGTRKMVNYACRG